MNRFVTIVLASFLLTLMATNALPHDVDVEDPLSGDLPEGNQQPAGSYSAVDTDGFVDVHVVNYGSWGYADAWLETEDYDGTNWGCTGPFYVQEGTWYVGASLIEDGTYATLAFDSEDGDVVVE